MKRTDFPLRAEIDKDVLTITIGVDTLAFAYCERIRNMLDEKEDALRINIVNKRQFAKDVCYETGKENEVGDTPLSDFLDEMMDRAVEEGSIGAEFPE